MTDTMPQPEQRPEDEPVPEGGHTLFTAPDAVKMKIVPKKPDAKGKPSREEAVAWLSRPVTPTQQARDWLAEQRKNAPKEDGSA